MPAAKGAAAEVPVCLSVQPVPVPRRQSVVTWESNIKINIRVVLVGKCPVSIHFILVITFDISSSHNKLLILAGICQKDVKNLFTHRSLAKWQTYSDLDCKQK